jgi:lysyl-tRNA synthetase class 1
LAEKPSLHWADQFADEIINRKKKDVYLVESGITPSGIVHAGNFREILTQDLVYRALLDKGKKAKYQYFWDDYDRFRKVPAGVPADYEQYLGLPVSKAPDPWECHSSYAEHFESILVDEIKACGVKVDYVFASKEYAECRFAEEIPCSFINWRS